MRIPTFFGCIVFLLIGAVGCGTATQVVGSGDKSIVLAESYERVSGGVNTVDFPPGIYVPDFKTKDGIYYRAPSKLTCRSLGIHQVLRGGVYVPFPSDSDQRQAAWFDLQGWTVSAPSRTFRFKQPIPFVIQNAEAN